jgi:Holliday junction resolvase RusA-like endonuclease
MIKFTVMGQPIPLARPRVVRNGRHIHTYIPEASVNYQELIAYNAKNASKETFTGPLALQLEFFRLGDRRCDLDNLVKNAMDGLTVGRIWENDNQVEHLIAKIQYASDSPRTNVTLYKLDHQE